MCGRSHLSLPPQRLRDSAAQQIGANLNQTVWVNQALYQPQYNFTMGAHLPLFYIDKNVTTKSFNSSSDKTANNNNTDEVVKKEIIKNEELKNSTTSTIIKKEEEETKFVKSESILQTSTNNQSSNKIKKEEETELKSALDGLCIRTMTWGIYSQRNKSYSLNIRSESVAEKFGSILRKNRAVLFVEGFYEWKSSTTVGGKGQPYYVHPKQKGSLLCLACLFDKKKSDADDDYTFSILTVDADKTFSQIHHRMPAILTNIEDIRRWLNVSTTNETNSLQSLLSLLKPYDFSQYLDMYKVSDFVNTTSNNTSKCIKPLSEIQHGKGSLHSFFKPAAVKRVKNEEDEDATLISNSSSSGGGIGTNTNPIKIESEPSTKKIKLT